MLPSAEELQSARAATSAGFNTRSHRLNWESSPTRAWEASKCPPNVSLGRRDGKKQRAGCQNDEKPREKALLDHVKSYIRPFPLQELFQELFQELKNTFRNLETLSEFQLEKLGFKLSSSAVGPATLIVPAPGVLVLFDVWPRNYWVKAFSTEHY